MIKVNPSLGATAKLNPVLGATGKIYTFGSNACAKYLTIGGPTPTQITDISGRGNHAAFTDAPTPVQLASGAWTYQFVSAQTNYCTIPAITELGGATAATWLAWVKKDAYVQYQVVASDYASTSDRVFMFGMESSENLWRSYAANDGVWVAGPDIAGAFTVGWHFVWMRFVASTSVESGCDNSTATTTVGVGAALGPSDDAVYVGRRTATYSSITLGALAIFPRAITDAERDQWRWNAKAALGV